MTPFFKTGTRKYRIRYSIMDNGVEYPREVTIESQSPKHARASLKAHMDLDVKYVIHTIDRL
jgi:hypothetical protein